MLTVFAKSVDYLKIKANDTLKRLDVFKSLSLLCVKVKKTFLLTFCRVGDSVDVSSKVLLGEKPILQVESLRCLDFHTDSILSWKPHSDIIPPKLHMELASSED